MGGKVNTAGKTAEDTVGVVGVSVCLGSAFYVSGYDLRRRRL